MSTILAVNAGSSSLKLSLFDAGNPSLPRIAHENFEHLPDEDARCGAIAAIGDWCRRHASEPLVAAGHRIVHGGVVHAAPVRINDTVLAELEALVPLAPLHQPYCIAPIVALRADHPDLVQMACFDTAFHRGRPSAVERYGLPDAMFREGIRRYGFHGLSYEFVAAELERVDPELARGRVIALHLGAGASLCAIKDGRSVDTTMGFSTLSGVMMATRGGDLDPGVILHLLRDGTRSIADVEKLLYHESGLLGVSGLSGDMRELLASQEPLAREAVDCFVLRIAREIGALTAMLGGLDGIVFTAGIGEHSSEIRRRIAHASSWTGLQLDDDANNRGGARISTTSSKVSAWVIATDEERRIAEHTRTKMEKA